MRQRQYESGDSGSVFGDQESVDLAVELGFAPEDLRLKRSTVSGTAVALQHRGTP